MWTFLFLVVLDNIVKTVTERPKRGISWRLMDTLKDLDYADDVCLLSHSHTDMQIKVMDPRKEALNAGLKINVDKTKEMRVNERTSARIVLGTKNIKTVQGFPYLGRHYQGMVAIRETWIEEVRSFAKSINIWRRNNTILKTKIKIFNACVKSVLLYGCQRWMVTEVIKRKLQAYVNRCLRHILRKRWPRKISNIDLRCKTNQTDINLEVRRRKFSCLGHTLRKRTDSVPRNASEWNVQGKGRRGRPKNNWRRTVEKEYGKSCKLMKSEALNSVLAKDHI
jgi:hypothetical protein